MTASEIRALHERSAVARAHAVAAALEYGKLLVESERSVTRSRDGRAASEAAREAFHRAVKGYVVLLKQLGTSPERTLRLVKEAVTETTARPEPKPLMDDVVHWCVEAYYGGSPAA